MNDEQHNIKKELPNPDGNHVPMIMRMKSFNCEREFEVHYIDNDIDPVLSVIVPVYGAETTIKQALMSLMKQCRNNGNDIEIVIVNDATPDSSMNVIDSIVADPNMGRHITVVTHSDNAGYGASMNDGIVASRGKWIGILEPDDYVIDGTASMLLAEIKNNGNVDIIKTPYMREIRNDGTKRGDEPKMIVNCSYKNRVHPAKQPFKIGEPGTEHLMRHHPSIWSAVYRREFLIANNILFVEHPGAGWADNEFFYRTMLMAEKIIYIDEPFYVYREETKSEEIDFQRRNKELPFDRWEAQDDIIHDLEITSERIKQVHISRGFTYLNGSIKANGSNDETVSHRACRMFDRMDPAIVARERKIKPSLRKMFLDYRGINSNGMLSWNVLYSLGLITEFFYTVSNNGFKFAFDQVCDFIDAK